VDYIATDRPLVAQEWLEGLVQRIELAADMPEQGRVVPEWHDDSVREILYEPVRLIYEVGTGQIEILTLSHFRQQLPLDPPAGSP
jgi:plasmid stabilization system protein ParE